MLASVDAVQSAATALDRADATCATGQGVAARSAHLAALPLTHRAHVALARLDGQVAAYRRALVVLLGASSTVDGAGRAALRDVVRDGQSEAKAFGAFRVTATALWPAYDRLNDDEELWITRAVMPWYRTPQEGAAAYAVLVDDHRAALTTARSHLAAAAAAVAGPSAAQSASLAAADRALSGLRTRTPSP